MSLRRPNARGGSLLTPTKEALPLCIAAESQSGLARPRRSVANDVAEDGRRAMKTCDDVSPQRPVARCQIDQPRHILDVEKLFGRQYSLISLLTGRPSGTHGPIGEGLARNGRGTRPAKAPWGQRFDLRLYVVIGHGGSAQNSSLRRWTETSTLVLRPRLT